MEEKISLKIGNEFRGGILTDVGQEKWKINHDVGERISLSQINLIIMLVFLIPFYRQRIVDQMGKVKSFCGIEKTTENVVEAKLLPW